MLESCPNPKPYCPYYDKKPPKKLRDTQDHGCHSSTHHAYWPARDYQTPIEKAFRELPENKIQECRWHHDDIHELHISPQKPDLIKMLAQLSLGGESEAA